MPEQFRKEVKHLGMSSITHHSVRAKGKSKKITQILDRVSIDISYSKVEDAIQILKQAANGLTDAKTEIEAQDGYYDSGPELVQFVEGWRDMTAEELGIYAEQAAVAKVQSKQRKEEYDRAELERLKEQHPEWIRDELK